MKRLLILPALLLLSACDGSSGPDALAVVAPTDALCRPTPNGRDATGCYITLTASRDDRLIGVASPVAAEGQIHEMRVQDGVMSMGELKDGLPLPAGEAVVLKPGGNHIMLLGLMQPLKVGDTVSLTLTFAHAGQIGVRARVAQPTVATDAMHH